jgi:lipopolysaccharide transport system ATP-binding protein
MSALAIRVEHLTKKYLLRHGPAQRYRTLRESIHRGVGRLLGRGKAQPDGTREEFFALRDLSFELERGQVLGIVGRNGAGKSTLLKLLSRITEPTSGRISIKGRVSSLLEVGTGFHPELTGRENIFLNGAILGMSKAELRRNFDAIVAFAETEKFLDTPVKHYSSGMYMRLAFSVAAHLQPEILIVDEVLAVGDAEFQKKCLGKMQDISHEGRTVLFVSHNMAAVRNLCSKVMVLQNGQASAFGETGEILDRHAAGISRTTWAGDAGNEKLRLRKTTVRPLIPGETFQTNAGIEVSLEVEILQPIRNLVLGFNLLSEFSHPLAFVLYDDAHPGPPPEVQPQRMVQRFVIPPCTLSHGTYQIQFDLGVFHVERIIFDEGSLSFTVENDFGPGRRFVAAHSSRHAALFRPLWAVPDADSDDRP